jgi:putative ABC transport system permease protein
MLLRLLRSFVSDAGFALRLLRRSPGFAVTLIGVLVLGIGAATAMFSVVSSLLLRPLPFPHPEQLTTLYNVEPEISDGPVSVRDFLDWKEQATSFSEMAVIGHEYYSVASEGERPESLPGAQVSGDFFPMLGVPPLRGRLLGPEDDRVGGPAVAVIGAELWHRRFASDERAVGKTIALGGEPFTIVGIAAEGFRFSGAKSDRSDVWVPLAVAKRSYPFLSSEEGRGSHFLEAIGRRKPGVSLAQSDAEIHSIAARLELEHRKSRGKISARAEDLHETLVGSSRSSIGILFAAVLLVFVIVCANVANLLLARTASRRAEMAARAALGATRGRLVAQLLIETLVVFCLAAVGGALVARLLVAELGTRLLESPALAIDLRVNGTALAFSIGLAVLFGFVVGLVPAAEACLVPPQTALKDSGARASLGRGARWARGGLVIVQVALACALLVGSGVAVRAYVKLASTPLGFEPDDLATATVVLPAAKYSDDNKLIGFYRDLITKVAAQPGVTSVSANGSIPMGSAGHNGSFSIEGRPSWPPGDEPVLERHTVMPGFFRTLGIPILRGRDFTDADVKDGRLVMVISKTTADRFFPGQDPIGQRIDWGDVNSENKTLWREIVGVVGDVRHIDWDKQLQPESYAPHAQHPDRYMTVVARTSRGEAFLHEFPDAVASIDSQQAVASRRWMSDRVAQALGPERFTVQLLGTFAFVALALATLGIFGLVSYATTQRTREFGIRLALGSSPRGLVALVMRDGARLLAPGLVLGLVGAVFAGRAIASRIDGASGFDPILALTIVAVLGVAGALASLIPALRAARIPPAISLRYE